MPQLDPSTYPPQLFWLVVVFAVLYLVMWKVALPRIGDLLQERQERIDDDLQKAEKLRNDAAAILESYEKTMAEGRAKAQTVLRAAADRMAAEAAERQAALGEKLAREAEAAEERIRAERERALADVRTAAVEVAQAAAARLIGGEIAEAEAGEAVAAALKEQG